VRDPFGFPLAFFCEMSQFDTQLQRFDLQHGAPIARIDPALEREQVRSLAAFKASRVTAALASALAAVDAAARGTENLMPPILAAVKAGATVGEISNTLRVVFGEHRESLVL
jgi:methylmalonyl-CoA mutase N-terminal domain/subunit